MSVAVQLMSRPAFLKTQFIKAVGYSADVVSLYDFGLAQKFSACANDNQPILTPEQYNDKEAVASNYQAHVHQMYDYFDQKGFVYAKVALGLLLELKADKMRKDGVVPDFGHEIKQYLQFMSLYKAGYIPENHPELGSMEIGICCILLHDVMEDFSEKHDLFYDDFVQLLTERLEKEQGRSLQPFEQEIVEHISKDTEMMTHYRKFSPERVQSMFPKSYIDLSNLPFNEGLRLPELEELFRSKMEVVPDCMEDFMVFGKMQDSKDDPEQKIPVIYVTRYGNHKDVKIDFTRYFTKGLQPDPWRRLAKGNDNVEALSTRIGIRPFNFAQYDHFIKERLAIFDLRPMTKEACRLHPILSEAFKSQGAMINILLKSNQEFLYRYHENVNCNAQVKTISSHLSSEAQIPNRIDLEEYVPRALAGYRFMTPDKHPLRILLEQIQEKQQDKGFDGCHLLVNDLQRSLQYHSKYWNIDPLVNQTIRGYERYPYSADKYEHT